MSRHGNLSVILKLNDIPRKLTKINIEKDYSYWKKLGKIGLSTLLEIIMRDYLNEILKIINGTPS